MAYRFHRTEAVSTAVRRIVRERVDLAIAELHRTGDERPKGVHEARKRIKEIRAVLRLSRHELGDCFRAENRWYRDTARELAAAREAQAAVETWEQLLARFPQELGDKAATIRNRLEQRYARIAADETVLAGPLAGVRDGLAEARARIGHWPLYRRGFAGINAGVRRSYARGRDQRSEALASSADEPFHEWRKRVKDLWYHTILLQRVWEEIMTVRRQRLKALSDTLGEDHDLVVFRQLIDAEARLFGTQRARAQLLALITVRQRELRTEAGTLGALLYAEKPDAYVRRIQAYWRVWRPQTQTSLA